ncbi:MAG: hypothetical protein C0524_10480 [Rhodobacter sp.]|nr:hypothetical protein [Rhodobacter sp.]
MVGLDAATVLVASLRAAGLPSGLVATSIPGGLSQNLICEAARVISPAAISGPDRLLVLSGQTATDTHFASLRRLAGSGIGGCVVSGRFDIRQAEIGIRAKFGYVLGKEPEVLALLDEDETLLASSIAPVFGVDRARAPDADGRLRVLLIAPSLEAGKGNAAFQALSVSRKLQVTILTDGAGKTTLRGSGVPLPVYHYGEVPLRALVARTDVAVFCQPVARSYAMRMMLADCALSGVALLDASTGFLNRKRDPAFIPAPSDPAALAGFLVAEVRPDVGDLARISRGSALARQSQETLAALRRALGERLTGIADLSADGNATLARPRVPASHEATAPESRVVFMPTNGVGLGHAQRCALVADKLAQGPVTPAFAAFPSCMRLIKSYGFDVMPLVPKSGLHAEPFANDVVNTVRLDHLLGTAAAFVFDGGHVFTSVFRNILEWRVPSVWIRRGLWQSGQDNSVALDREKAFDRVIVPLEAFSELNEDYSHGAHIVRVGPIVQQIDLSQSERGAIRQGLAARYGRSFEHLVVTMLGGGVAADRSAQTIAVAASLARRSDALHLVVVWPTATIDPGLYSWPNTRVVRTHHASVLAAAADLYISAVGYNSFHEAMYNRIPTIFVPQMAQYMDDQRSRAAAAVERDLARLVEPQDLLTLDRTIARMLDAGEAEAMRSRLHQIDLPASGAAAAAACIADLAKLGAAVPTDEPVRRIA